MKAGIVNFSTLGKYKRWDAGFFLADTTELDPAIERAKKAIEDAQARLKRLEEEKAAGAEFTGGLIKSGELIPIKNIHETGS
jgi:hypothetical protein